MIEYIASVSAALALSYGWYRVTKHSIFLIERAIYTMGLPKESFSPYLESGETHSIDDLVIKPLPTILL